MSKRGAPVDPWVFEVAWGRPNSDPPAGLSRVQLSVTRVQAGGHPMPEEIDARFLELGGPGSGWCVRCGQDIEAVRRTLPLASKQSMRRKSLARRIQRKAPLFAEQLIQVELAKQPDYYGTEVKP